MTVMRGGQTSVERMDHWMNRMSSRQRVVILTFPSAAEAEAWDAAGGTLDALSTPDELDGGQV